MLTNVISRLFGALAHKQFPTALQTFINEFYVKKFNINMSEFKEPKYYESLNKLFIRDFTRKRAFKKDAFTLISMCDSFITESGKINKLDISALQIKGFAYSVGELLGDFTHFKDKDKLKGGLFMNFYLSPSDYHHYHAPCDMKIVKATHIPGKLYPVNLTWLNKKASLFTENERVVLECETVMNKRFYLVFVGALNVGKMRFLFDENISTNVKHSSSTLHIYNDLKVFQGEELGYFEMGSTVLFFGEKDIFAPLVGQGTKVRFGDRVIQIIK